MPQTNSGASERQRGKAEGLQQQIRGGRAQGAQQIGDLAAIGIVEAGIVGMIADQRHQRRQAAANSSSPAPRSATMRASRASAALASASASLMAPPLARG